METSSVLSELRSRGICLRVADGMVIAEYDGELADNDREAIRFHRAGLLALLEHAASGREQPPTWPPRSAELATWPPTWRERWGVVANELEAPFIGWDEAEYEAFSLVQRELAEFEAEHGPVQRSTPAEPDATGRWPLDPEPDGVTATGSSRGPRDVRRGDRWLGHHGGLRQ